VSRKQSFSVYRAHGPAEQVKKTAKAYVDQISKLDFGDKVLQSLVLFQEGLESNHIDIALLKFWTGIEVLCAREEREATERIIERASSIFSDRKHAMMRLNFMQEFRNKIVHRGEASDHSLLSAQWGSIYLAGIIRFCLFNTLRIRTRSDLLDYLSAPTDESTLKNMLSWYRKRLVSVRRARAL
jgi:hypothetical protein